MAEQHITERVGELVESLTDQVIAALGSISDPLSKQGVRHVLSRNLGKVVAEHLLRASTK
ncbi:MAG: hypothetical protein ABI605_16710 [Rhizobacter sp.]